MDITLLFEDVGKAILLALRTMGKFGGLEGHYTNSLRSHFIGKLGEFAVLRWAEGHALETEGRFLDPGMDGECDLVIEFPAGAKRVEVKAWSLKYWSELGRCVAVEQLPIIRDKADLIVWVVVSGNGALAPTVSLKGWSTIAEVQATAPRMTGWKGMRLVNNHQVEERDLHPPAELLQ